jgi:hypothetical protein
VTRAERIERVALLLKALPTADGCQLDLTVVASKIVEAQFLSEHFPPGWDDKFSRPASKEEVVELRAAIDSLIGRVLGLSRAAGRLIDDQKPSVELLETPGVAGDEEIFDLIGPLAVMNEKTGSLLSRWPAGKMRWDKVGRGPARRKRGPKPMHVAAAVTRFAAHFYEEITGRPSTNVYHPSISKADSPFLRFLKAVFKALEINASAEWQIKLFRRELREGIDKKKGL